MLFGPAYKGIPLGVVTAIAYSDLYGKEVRYCSDRKEEKDHGADKGSFLGSKLKDGDRVIMIEDVTTSGKSMEETVPKVKGAADVTIVGLMVSLNRMEVGKGGEKCALDEIKDLYGFDTAAIVTMEEVVECLYNKECDGKVVIDDTLKEAIDAYYEQYGAKIENGGIRRSFPEQRRESRSVSMYCRGKTMPCVSARSGAENMMAVPSRSAVVRNLPNGLKIKSVTTRGKSHRK